VEERRTKQQSHDGFRGPGDGACSTIRRAVAMKDIEEDELGNKGMRNVQDMGRGWRES
jgi:hypothetical protein